MTVSYWQDSKQKVARKVDVVIIGGGIMGAACAYWLSKRTNIKAIVLEAHQRAWGASGRGAGFAVRTLFAYYNQAIAIYGREKSKWLLDFNEESLGLLAEVIETHGNKCEYDPCGSYLLACTPEEMQELELSAQLLSEDGFRVEAHRKDPLGRGYCGGIYNPTDVAVDTRLLVNMLLELSKVPVLEGETVWRIEPAQGGSVRVLSTTQDITCDRVLLVTNAYAPLLEQWFAGKLQPVRGQILVTKPLKIQILDSLYSANYGWDYFRQLPDKRILLGGRRFMFRSEESGFEDKVTAGIQEALEQYLAQHLPEAVQAGIDYRWSGTMAFTQDELPIVGELIRMPITTSSQDEVGAIPGAYYALGCNGHGLAHIMGLTRLFVATAMDGQDAGPFSYSRLDTDRSKSQWAHAQQPG